MMRLKNCPAYGQSHSCPGDMCPMCARAIKLVEDQCLVHCVNAYPTIGDAHSYKLASSLRADKDRLRLRGVLRRILQQIAKDFLYPHGIGLHQGETLSNLGLYLSVRQDPITSLAGMLNKIVDSLRTRAHMYFLGIKHRHLHSLRNQAVK